jgi:hypothetical protein
MALSPNPSLPLPAESDGEGRRAALVIATQNYLDDQWRPLSCPVSDAEKLAEVLSNPRIGDFHTEVLIDASAQQQRLALAEFFVGRRREDLLVVHIACHGEKDRSGRLHFAATDTAFAHVAATGVPASLVHDLMTNSRSHRVVLLLDCCFGAAFANEATPRGEEARIDFNESFAGEGRAVIAASASTQYAWEVGGVDGQALFTGAVTEGLASGDADVDRDGWISVLDLHQYLDQKLTHDGRQTPTLDVMSLEGMLVLAASPRSPAGPLPTALAVAVTHPLMPVRRDAVISLAQILDGQERELANAARLALRRMTDDDSRSVAAAARQALGEAAPVRASRPRVSSSERAEAELQGLHRKDSPRVEMVVSVAVDELVAGIDA